MSEENKTIKQLINEQVAEWRHPKNEIKNLQADKVVKKLKCDFGNCNDCGLEYEKNRTIIYRKVNAPIPHWNIKCSVCGLWQDPRTSKFKLEYRDLFNYYLNNFAKTK
jgi:hypothetical protein